MNKQAQSIPTPILLTLALCSGFSPFAIDTYIAGLPEITEDLQTTASLTQATLTGFLLALGLTQLVVGPWSDQFGRRKLMLVGLFGATVASVACALAPNIWVLIIARILQGGFGAAGVVLARAAVGDLGQGIGVAKAFAMLMSIQSLAPLVAPIVGGLMIPSLGWRSVFWFLAALAAIMFVSVFFLVPETLPESERSSGGVKASLRDIRVLLNNPTYVAPLTVFVATFAVMFAYIAASPFVLQRIGSLGQVAYSVVFTVNALGLFLMNLVSRALVPKVGPVRLTQGGVVLSVVSVVWLGLGVIAFDTASWAMIPGFFGVVTAAGIILPNASALCIEASADRRGAGSALMGAVQFSFAAIIAPLTGIGDGTTAVPMLIVMAVGAVAQTVFLRSLIARHRVLS
ncbi:multidrug effflux MFS transporter [Corynebacterium cystitidis]|uniref:MFS transporter, DHA1 family, bicyclomycin/chloramphenicol resistance protein n=1 Tax=Corynebacterium cystitidis DSM 20524 TaxID=1121357 RepID=A0A1H9WAP6_9CORY|nr:multidrug effflux MFS transporter [Corynebacterium cystitidis]WJY82952.1 Bicyclomycin resistance protein [Corynebacterium cystitidis DSM 20524]SES30988.1 MFS transporter, DHA1 family, bicyclomycin/chloramphenicol resistance protein [Corynebacterium cystitidis DSM 20524]SNV68674.1 major facilitator superfamily permease [Corynebacterium cystitidis]